MHKKARDNIRNNLLHASSSKILLTKRLQTIWEKWGLAIPDLSALEVVSPVSLVACSVRIVECSTSVPLSTDKVSIVHVAQRVLGQCATAQVPDVLAEAVLQRTTTRYINIYPIISRAQPFIAFSVYIWSVLSYDILSLNTAVLFPWRQLVSLPAHRSATLQCTTDSSHATASYRCRGGCCGSRCLRTCCRMGSGRGHSRVGCYPPSGRRRTSPCYCRSPFDPEIWLVNLWL